MSNRYRVRLPLTVHTTKASYTQGEEFDGAETAEDFDEAANLQSGLLEIVPREYKVIGGSNVHGADPGEVFTAALPIGQEAALIQGGHIERVDDKPKSKKKEEAK